MHNVLIVGASRGIGLGLADAFLQRGAQVFAVARRPQGSPGLQALAERAGERLQAVTGDLNQRDCAERIGEALGERRIDCGEVTVLTHAKRGMDRLEPL